MDIYEDEVNFESLSAQDSDFAAVIRANGGRIDFKNPRIVKYELYLRHDRHLSKLDFHDMS